VAVDRPDAVGAQARAGSAEEPGGAGDATGGAAALSGALGADEPTVHAARDGDDSGGADGGAADSGRAAAAKTDERVRPLAAVWRFLFPKKPRPFIVELPFLLVFALFLAFLIKTFLVQAFFIPSGSMQNTLAIGDRVLVNRAATWLGSQPQRGEVVVFQDPGGWLSSEETAPSGNWLTNTLSFIGVLPQDNGDLIKRVIGVGGDHVVCCNPQGEITVNGVALNEPYLYPGDSPSSSPGGNGSFNVVVPKGELWVMGDHRSVSEDSRLHTNLNGGFVPVSDVVGRADVIIWPASQWATLPIPNTFKQAGIGALNTPGGVPAAAALLAVPPTLLRRRFKLRKRQGGKTDSATAP
jgi:signal peptidase I